jgi:hypothetical protein
MRSFLLLLVLLHRLLSAANVELFVAPNGDDKNPGTKEKSKASLAAARDALRALKKEGKLTDGATVWLGGGLYSNCATLNLTWEDSGTAAAPIVYRAIDGEEPRLSGGVEIPATAFKPVTDAATLERLDENARGKVLAADLKALGISDYGVMKSRGFGRNIHPAGLELFFQDKPLQLARWPNGNGWSAIAGVPSGGDRFNFDGDRPKRWAKAEDIWIHGYWMWDWADSYENVASIDLAKREIITKPPHGVCGYSKGKRFCALNLLEEIDEPGEWYLNRSSGVLYFWPPQNLEQGRIFVSLRQTPLILTENASFVTFRGLTLECTRGDGLEIRNGSHVLVADCTLRNIGNVAVKIESGTDHAANGCDISYCGDSGIHLNGGERKTLTPGNNVVDNCHIHHYSRWSRTYRPAVMVNGVGQRVTHNKIHDAPHNAILLGGNEHLVEFNDIYRVCTDTGDAGAFYIGRDWTQRGNVVRYNFFHELEGVKSEHGFVDVMGVYLDDAASGTTVFGNVFYKVKRAIMVGGGRDNSVENNFFADCPISIHVDARGIGWAKDHIKLEGGDWGMKKKLEDMKWNQLPYSTKYPKLATMLDEEPYMPRGTVLARNVSQGGKQFELQDKLDDTKISIKDNFHAPDVGFVDTVKLNFALKDDSPALKTGVQKIPLEKIGLYVDEYRKKLPPKE